MVSIIALIFLIGFYRTCQMAQHGKLSNNEYGFFGSESWLRKYKTVGTKLLPRWPTSTTLTVFVTDWYHLSQFLWLRCLNLIVADSLLFPFWKTFIISWAATSILMFTTETIFKKDE